MINAKSNPSPQETILQLTMGFAVTQAIFAIVKLGVPDLIADSAHSCDSLAQKTNADAETLYRFLRALAGVGIFAETTPGHFEHTPLSCCLRADVPGSLRDLVLLREESYTCWSEVLYTLRTGLGNYERVYDMSREAYLQRNPDFAAIFNRGMQQVAARQNKALLTHYDFAVGDKLIDVGGGMGHRLAAILQQYPTMTGMLYETSASVVMAEIHLREAGVLDRCELMAGDMFHHVPAGGAIYLLDAVHRWPDDTARMVLQNCHRAMGEAAKLLVIERVITADSPWRIHFADLNMLVVQGGKIRTESEYRQLFESAGLRLDRLIPTQSPVSILECVSSPN